MSMFERRPFVDSDASSLRHNREVLLTAVGAAAMLFIFLTASKRDFNGLFLVALCGFVVAILLSNARTLVIGAGLILLGIHMGLTYLTTQQPWSLLGCLFLIFSGVWTTRRFSAQSNSDDHDRTGDRSRN